MGILLDIDGTVLVAGKPVEGAADAIAELHRRGIPLLFATNISRQPRSDIARSLRQAGVDVREEEILSAAYAAAVMLRAEGVRRVQLLLPRAAQADWSGFEIVDEAPEAVVVGDLGREFDFDTLNGAFRSLHDGARLVAVHKNRCWRSPDGWTVDAGAFVAALEYAARVEAELIGKPSPGFFRMAAKLLGRAPETLAIVGDDVEVDVAGGRAAGLTTWLVRTGKFDAARVEALPAERAPHHVIDSLRDLPGKLPH